MLEVGDGPVTATPGTWDQSCYVLEPDQAIVLDP
jgi:hypothetical protein